MITNVLFQGPGIPWSTSQHPLLSSSPEPNGVVTGIVPPFYWWGTSGPESIIVYGHSYQGPEPEFTCLFTRLQLKKTSCMWCLFEFHLDLCTRGSWWCVSRERTRSCGLEKGCETQGPHCAGEGRKRPEEEKLELGSQCGWEMDPQGGFHKCSKLKLMNSVYELGCVPSTFLRQNSNS